MQTTLSTLIKKRSISHSNNKLFNKFSKLDKINENSLSFNFKSYLVESNKSDLFLNQSLLSKKKTIYSNQKDKIKGKVKKGLLASVLFNETFQISYNEQLIETHFNSLKLNSMLQSLVSLISLLIQVLYIAIYKYEDPLNQSTKIITYSVMKSSLLLFSSVITVILIILIIFDFFIQSYIAEISDKIPSNIWRKRKENIIYLLVLVLISTIHPNPLFLNKSIYIYLSNYKTYIEYDINSLLSIAVLFRFIFFYKFIFLLSSFNTPRIKRLSKMNLIRLNINLFTFKSLLKTNPLFIFSFISINLIFNGAYTLIIMEGPSDSLTNLKLNSWWNTLWYIANTITTVGYGDVNAKTTFGRLVIIVTSFAGTFLLSIIISSFNSIFTFDQSEVKAYTVINKILRNKEKETLSKKIIKDLALMKKYFTVDLKNCKTYKESLHMELIELDKRNKAFDGLNNTINTNILYIYDLTQKLDNDINSLFDKYEIMNQRILQINQNFKRSTLK